MGTSGEVARGYTGEHTGGSAKQGGIQGLRKIGRQDDGGQEVRVPSRCGARLVLSGRKKHELESVRARCLEAGRYRDLQVLRTVHGLELCTASYLQPDHVMVLPLDLAKPESHSAAVRSALGKMTKVTAS